jgi:DNA mismatch repair protein MutS
MLRPGSQPVGKTIVFDKSKYDFATPMMSQYLDIKEKYPDCVIFFRLGDFYEMFLDDAKLGAEVLDITLTSRSRGKDGRIPMAGVPYHAADAYLSKMVRAGYKVAVCEQVSEPDGTNLVDRDVIRIVTPGTLLDEKSLDRKQNNYVIALNHKDNYFSISAADLSTGDFQTTQIQAEDVAHHLHNELSRFSPTEAILPHDMYNNAKILSILNTQPNLNVYPFSDWEEFSEDGKALMQKHFAVNNLSGFGLQDKPHSTSTSSALLGYLKYTQKDQVGHLKKISYYHPEDHVVLDRSTITNLELFSTIRDGKRRGTLYDVLDRTSTSMGARLLRKWILKPLTDKKMIENRLDVVEEFVKKHKLREDLQGELKEISDIERLLARLATGLGNARDLVSLKVSLGNVMQVKGLLNDSNKSLTRKISKSFNKDLQFVVSLIEDTILDEPSFDVRDGNIIKQDIDRILDSLNMKSGKSKDFIAKLETKEKKRTGISSLKIKFNKIFGYYIEVSKSNLDLVPDDYERKQTLVNAERFVTPALKEHEQIILEAEEKTKQIEYEIFLKTVGKVLKKIEGLQNAAYHLAMLDVLLCFAQISSSRKYARPNFVKTGVINIKEGRHPVVEELLDTAEFVPNDVLLDQKEHQLLVLTGPNMSGKSVYLRQVAIIVLMGQMGCYVPAKKAEISLVDKIFVRSGASDVIASGLSTFMVEMVETAYILNNATKESLIVMDEIGRGTSTYDGISIAWSVAEYLVTHTKAKSLFATHYHELQSLEDKFDNIKNFQVAVNQDGDDLVFLHKVIKGGASHSHGVAVASLAGVPSEVTDKACEILGGLEDRSVQNEVEAKKTKLNSDVEERLKKIKIEDLTPLDALNLLADLAESVD